MPDDTLNVVVSALSAEYVRARIKLRGAAKRLLYAQSQAVIEEGLVAEYQADLDMLADAILSSGGQLPPDIEDPA